MTGRDVRTCIVFHIPKRNYILRNDILAHMKCIASAHREFKIVLRDFAMRQIELENVGDERAEISNVVGFNMKRDFCRIFDREIKEWS